MGAIRNHGTSKRLRQIQLCFGIMVLGAASTGYAAKGERGAGGAAQGSSRETPANSNPPRTDECAQVVGRLSNIERLVASAPAQWTETGNRITLVEAALKKPSDGISEKITIALFGLLGVFVGGVINGWIQHALARRRASFETAGARRRAEVETAGAFSEWQFTQLFELYGPLRAAFGQSKKLYDQLRAHLIASQNDRFRFEKNRNDPRPDFKMRIADDQWILFLTVVHLGDVYGKGYGVDGYFDEIVAIGGRITKIIEEKAGYVRPENEKLIAMLGQYLAHFAVLKQVHSEAQARVQGRGIQTVAPMKVDRSAVFPREIEALIQQDYQAINKDLTSWRQGGVAGK